MGLDMYLSKETYVQNWDHHTLAQRHVITITRGDGKPVPIKPERITEITEQVGYWRKANHIHAWFVTNVQDGIDECQRSNVEREQLRALLDVCQTVRDDHSKAGTLLPTQSGFFFGGTEFDESYYQDIDYTIQMLAGVLAEPEGSGEFYYRASW